MSIYKISDLPCRCENDTVCIEKYSFPCECTEGITIGACDIGELL